MEEELEDEEEDEEEDDELDEEELEEKLLELEEATGVTGPLPVLEESTVLLQDTKSKGIKRTEIPCSLNLIFKLSPLT